MRIIYIPSLNVSFVFFNKSGSSMFIAWMEILLKNLDFEYQLLKFGEYGDGEKSTIFLALKKAKIYLFVRNPLERIVTSFYWMETFNIKEQDSMFPIGDFIEYALNIEHNYETTNDPHVLPQTWELVKGNNILNKRENSLFEFKNFRYDKRFFKECDVKIIQIENFKSNFDNLMKYSASVINYPHYNLINDLGNNFYFQKSIGQTEELWKDSNNSKKLFAISLYNFFDNHYKILPHHNNLYKGMIQRLQKTKEGVESLIKVNEMIANESKWLGYDNSLILNTNKFN